MSRSVSISIPRDNTDRLLSDLSSTEGIIGITLHRGASVKPVGDAILVHVTNEGLVSLLSILAKNGLGPDTSVVTSEPRSIVSPTSQDQIDRETNEASWPEMAALLRRETNVTSNYLIAMFFAGVVAAAGLWTQTVHIVVGAMVLAPGFEPIIRIPFGLLGRQTRARKQGLSSTALGYLTLVIGAAMSALAMALLDPSSADLGEREWVQYWSTTKASSVLIALAAGAAGAAIIAAQRSVLSAGVMIALALVPSAAITGMALAFGDFQLAGQAVLRWAADAVCVIVSGGLIFFLKRGGAHRGEGTTDGSVQI